MLFFILFCNRIDSKWLTDILHEEKRMIFLNFDCLTSNDEINADLDSKDYSQFNDDESVDLDSSLIYANSRNSSQNKNDYFDKKRKNKNLYNKIDLKLIVYLAKKIVNCGLTGENLGIITPLNSEKRYLSTRLEVC